MAHSPKQWEKVNAALAQAIQDRDFYRDTAERYKASVEFHVAHLDEVRKEHAREMENLEHAHAVTQAKFWNLKESLRDIGAAMGVAQ
jgi:hypothetical protein